LFKQLTHATSSGIKLCSEPVPPIPIVLTLQNAYSKLMPINALNMTAIDSFIFIPPTDPFYAAQ
jgi:hypothetical protein